MVNDKPSGKSPQDNRIFTTPFIVLMFAAFLLQFSMSLQGTALPLYMQEVLFRSKTDVGMMLTAFTMVSLVFRFIVGGFIERFGVRLMMIIGSAIMCVSTLVFGLFTTLPMLFLLRGIQGAGFAFQSSASNTAASYILPKTRITEGIGYFGLSMSLSQAIGPLLSLTTVDLVGYDNIFYIFGGIAFLAILAAFAVKNIRPDEDDTPSAAAEQIVEITASAKTGFFSKIIEKSAIMPSLCFALTGFGAATTYAFLPTYGISLGIGNIGLYFTVQACALALSRVTVGKLNKHIGEKRLLPIAMCMMSVSFLGIFLSKSLMPILICGALYGYGNGVMSPVLNAMVINRSSVHNRGRAISIFYAFIDIGFGLGSAVWGIVADNFGFSIIFAAAAIFPLFSLALYMTKLREKKQAVPAV